MDKQMLSLQMYSLRDITESDMLGSLEKVAEIGYKAVEFGGYFHATAGTAIYGRAWGSCARSAENGRY
ncbi:hypothetical protein SAMN04487969_12843 [Paenibacillus algorifonticola]|uniref:Xylose isomerase-like TIM barrel n=1 Tax=Paenibacillus algorifonticola TaxID=684063 RepID=A0A1I2I1I0_9BACL|nr:hypothetical protein [Paenibacillus algorifonticola]SFF34766.1 hypothetical protein SAMN04487969_12843 [Paenibacillus algorifonticola]